MTFLVRPRRAAQLAADGLVVRSPRGDITRPVQTVGAGALGGPYDAVVLSCKAYDLDDAIASFAPAVGPGTAILPLLNGMRHLDVLAARFSAGAVLGGASEKSGRVEPMATRPWARRCRMRRAGGRAGGTIMQDMWEKWVFLASLACLSSLMRAAVGDVVAAGGTEIAQGLFDEAAGIAAGQGHAPRPAFAEQMRGMLGQAGLNVTASMLRDIERGGRIEADHIVGDLIARGAAADARLLRIAFVHLEAHETRRAQGQG